MTIDLYCLRHGEAERFMTSDAARALTPHGISEVRSAAAHLYQDLVGVADALLIAASPYKRAQQSAEVVLDTLSHLATTAASGSEVPVPLMLDLVTVDQVIPSSRPQAAIKAIDALITERHCTKLLVVTHLPLVSMLIDGLVTGECQERVAMGTAYLAKLRMEHVGLGQAEKVWIKPPVG